MKERIVRAVAGSFVLISRTLGYFINISWLGLGVFVGLNLIQSPITSSANWKRYLHRWG